METSQIYQLVNNVFQQSTGRTDIAVTDTQSLVSMGNIVLSSTTYTEGFLNTLVQRIGRTILAYRTYRNKLDDLVLNDFEYGAILQKISFVMPEAEADQMYDLTDGDSVDHYKINKPKAIQKLFASRTPYQFHVTIQRVLLKEAFLSDSGMAGFIAGVMAQVRNRIELSLEELGRATYANFIAEIAGTNREVKLLTEYNAESGEALTKAQALRNPEFLRYMVYRINNASHKMTDMSTLYNDATVDRFTPVEDQRLRVLYDIEGRLETIVQYDAYHADMVKLGVYKTMNFWQNAKTPDQIIVKRASDGTETTVSNIVAVLHDRDALGIYKKDTEVLTTPVNAAAAYYNTYWHEKQLWFNDLSENALLFTLN